MASLLAVNHIVAAGRTPEQLPIVMSHVQLSDLFHWMTSKTMVIQEQSVWVMDNAAQDFVRFHGEMLSAGVLHHITEVSLNNIIFNADLFNSSIFLQAMKSASIDDRVSLRIAQLLETLTRDDGENPAQNSGDFVDVVPSIGSLMDAKHKVETVKFAARALWNITKCDRQKDNTMVAKVLATNQILPRLITLAKLVSSGTYLAELAVSTVTNLCYTADKESGKRPTSWFIWRARR